MLRSKIIQESHAFAAVNFFQILGAIMTPKTFLANPAEKR
jgi:hypothetical protein